MMTGEIKNRIDSLWNTFWTGGLTNPLDVIEQMTYLMFIHDLDVADNLRTKESAMLELPYHSIFAGEIRMGEEKIEGRQLKWSVFHDLPAGKMYEIMQKWVFPFIKRLHVTHGIENPCIEYRDSLSDQNADKEQYSLILANPPFKGSLDYDTVLHLNQISEFDIICPPREEQQAFVFFVAQIDKSKLTIRQSLDKLEMLKKALMQQYFGG